MKSESSSFHVPLCGPWTLYRPWIVWNSPGQSTGVSRYSLLPGIFPTQGSNSGLLHCKWIPYKLSHQWSSKICTLIINESKTMTVYEWCWGGKQVTKRYLKIWDVEEMFIFLVCWSFLKSINLSKVIMYSKYVHFFAYPFHLKKVLLKKCLQALINPTLNFLWLKE